MDAASSIAPAQPTIELTQSTTADAIPPSPPATTTPLCYFTDKLSAEIRIRIYQYVFPCARARRFKPTDVPISNEDSPPSSLAPSLELEGSQKDPMQAALQVVNQRVSTEVFAVNKLISAESLEAFYDNTVISATFEEFESLTRLLYTCPLIRDVEILSCNSKPYPDGYIPGLLIATQSLQRLKSFTIISDFLTPTGNSEGHTTVRQFAADLCLGPVICTDIGKYKLCGQLDGITFAHEQLLQMWPQVTNTPEEFDALDQVRAVLSESSLNAVLSNIMAWGAHTSLRIWVGLLQQFSDRLLEENIDPSAGLFELGAFKDSLVGEIVLPRNFQLRELGTSDNTVLLERVTEMFSVNIQSYVLTLTDEEDVIMRPRWVELGNESEIERQVTYQAKRREAFDDFFAMEDPIDGHRWDYGTMIDELLRETMVKSVHGMEEILGATKEAMHSIFKLHYALGLVVSPTTYDADQTVAFKKWSMGLLRRHIYLARVEEAGLLNQAPLWLLRTVLNVAFGMSATAEMHPTGAQEADDDEGDARDTGEDVLDETGGSVKQVDEETDDGAIAAVAKRSSAVKTQLERAMKMVVEDDTVDYDADDIIVDELDEHVCMTFVRGSGRYIRSSWAMLYPEIEWT